MMEFIEERYIPYKDPQAEAPWGHCSRCGGELYQLDAVYEIDCQYVCVDCATDEEEERYYTKIMDDRIKDAYSIYLEELHESILQGD